jgi:RNA polymerase sigma factor (sigma-70 family)
LTTQSTSETVGAGRGSFVPTRWTLVLTAGRADTTRAHDALAELCRTYWYPLYAYARRRGNSPADAEDLTQGFFARLLRLNSLADVRRDKGKFRAFLLASMNHYLADARDHDRAQRRDVQRTIALDAEAADTRYRREPADHLTPERLFERQWALNLLETVVQRLRQEYEASGRGMLFGELRWAISGGKSEVPYDELAVRLGLSEAAVRVAAHRLRKRYRQVLREEIAHTVADPADVEAELQYLRRVLSG